MTKRNQNQKEEHFNLPTSFNELLELADLCTVLQGDLYQYRHVSDYMKNIETQIKEYKERIWKELEKLEDE